jgi:hypothetical protein
MPNCDFYAANLDHRAILEWLLANRECDIYELNSRPGVETVRFEKWDDFEATYQFSYWEAIPCSMLLQLYVHSAKGAVSHRRIELKHAPPDKAFRHATEGWGLIQLYLEAPRKGILRASHTNHNSATRANNWRDTINDMGEPEDWDWPEVTSFSRRLNTFIRKLAVDKIGSRPILPGANQQRLFGTTLWPS